MFSLDMRCYHFFYLVPCFSPFKYLFYIGCGDGFSLFLLFSLFPLILVLYGDGFLLFSTVRQSFLLFSTVRQLFLLFLPLFSTVRQLFLLFLPLFSTVRQLFLLFLPLVSQHIKNKPLFDWLALNLF